MYACLIFTSDAVVLHLLKVLKQKPQRPKFLKFLDNDSIMNLQVQPDLGDWLLQNALIQLAFISVVYQKKQEDNMSSSYPNTQCRQQQKRNTEWFPLSLWGCSSSSHHVLLFLAVSQLFLLPPLGQEPSMLSNESKKPAMFRPGRATDWLPFDAAMELRSGNYHNMIQCDTNITSQMVVVVYSFPSAITSPLAKVNMETSGIWTEVSKAHPDRFGCPRQRPYSLEASRWRQRSGEKIFENRIQYERYTAMQSGACSSF